MSTTEELGDGYAPRPGTPMIGVYALLGPVVATALGEAAIETLYICSRKPE